MRNREDFDVVGADPLPSQEAVRPERPPRNLREFVRFLDEIEAVFGPSKRRPRVVRGDRFLL